MRFGEDRGGGRRITRIRRDEWLRQSGAKLQYHKFCSKNRKTRGESVFKQEEGVWGGRVRKRSVGRPEGCGWEGRGGGGARRNRSGSLTMIISGLGLQQTLKKLTAGLYRRGVGSPRQQRTVRQLLWRGFCTKLHITAQYVTRSWY